MKILIVEDEKNTRNSLTECIRRFGLGFEKILMAKNAEQAFHIFEAERPEIVVTDIRMPGGSGMELAEKIREADRNAQIIFLTAYSELELMKNALHVNAVDYILKPVSTQELKMALIKAVENSNSFILKNTTLLRGKFFRSLLIEKQLFSPREFKRIKGELGFPDKGLCYGVIAVENINMEKYWTFGNPEYMPLELTPPGRIIKEELKEFPFVYSFVHHKGRVLNVCGMPTAWKDSALRQAAVRLGDRIYEECFEKTIVKVGEKKTELFYLRDEAEQYTEVKLTCEVPAMPGKGNVTEKDRYIAECINRFVCGNYADAQLKVSDIADELCYTSAYLCMVYKKVTGNTINDYLNMYRIEKSRQLLEEGNRKLEQVAARVGYSNENYFAKVFKKFEGISPKEYQIRIHKNKEGR